MIRTIKNKWDNLKPEDKVVNIIFCLHFIWIMCIFVAHYVFNIF